MNKIFKLPFYDFDMGKAIELKYKVLEPIEPSDELTIDGLTVHKTREGEDAHIISGWFIDKGDYLVIDFEPDEGEEIPLISVLPS